MSISTSTWRGRAAMVAALVLGFAAITASVGSGQATAKGGGGTAKPPTGNPAPLVPPTWPTVPAPNFSTNTANIHGFDDTGFIQKATADPTRARRRPQRGRWHPRPQRRAHRHPVQLGRPDAGQHLVLGRLHRIGRRTPALALDGSGSGNGTPSANKPYPSFEIHAIGNIVGNKRIAGLVFAVAAGVQHRHRRHHRPSTTAPAT